MLDLRKRIFIIIGVAAGIIAAIVLLIFVLYNKQSDLAQDTGDDTPYITSGETNTQGNGAVLPGTSGAPSVSSPIYVSDEDAEERYVRHLARTFVERFGSYSNQNGNMHIEEAKLLASRRMQSWIDSQAITQTGEYEGATTQVISSDVTAYSDASATVIVGVQEVIRTRTGEEQRNYNNGRVELVREVGEWKIDALYWE